MSTYVPVLALQSGVKLGETPISTSTVTVVDVDQHRDDLAAAERQGKIIVAGAVTSEATGIVVTSGGVVTQSAEPGKIDVSAGVLYDRGEEAETAIPAKAKLALKAADKHKDRTSLGVVKTSDGSTAVVDGTLAEPGESVAPAPGSGHIALAAVLVKATWPKPEKPVVITDLRPRP